MAGRQSRLRSAGMSYRMISCDDHLDIGYLPADLWTSRMPAAGQPFMVSSTWVLRCPILFSFLG